MSRQYPRGKVRPDDDGQLRLAVFVKDGTLYLDFGKPVAWLGLGIADAEALVAGLQRHIDAMKAGAA